MIPAFVTRYSPTDEKEARRLLQSAKPVDNDALRTWLDAMPSPTAADLLAKISEGAQRVPVSLGIPLAVFAVMLVGWGVARIHNSSFPVPPIFLFCLWSAIASQRKSASTTARKAAFLLAQREDYRAIAPLAKLWEVKPPKAANALHDCEELERTLTRLLTALTANKYENLADDAVRDMLNRAFPPLSQHGKQTILEDLSETRADLLIAALRYLSHATPGKESALTRELIARIASFPVQHAAPHRSLVHETAALCLDPMHGATPLASVASVAQTVGIR